MTKNRDSFTMAVRLRTVCYYCGKIIQSGCWMPIKIGKVSEYANVCRECYDENKQ